MHYKIQILLQYSQYSTAVHTVQYRPFRQYSTAVQTVQYCSTDSSVLQYIQYSTAVHTVQYCSTDNSDSTVLQYRQYIIACIYPALIPPASQTEEVGRRQKALYGQWVIYCNALLLVTKHMSTEIGRCPGEEEKMTFRDQ
jgi:hypothetical protein